MLKCRFSGKILMVWPRNLHLSHDSGASGPWSSPWRNTASEGWNRGMSRATLWAWSFRPVGPLKSSQMLETAVTQRVYPALGRKRSDKKGVDCTLKMSNNANSFDGEFGWWLLPITHNYEDTTVSAALLGSKRRMQQWPVSPKASINGGIHASALLRPGLHR